MVRKSKLSPFGALLVAVALVAGIVPAPADAAAPLEAIDPLLGATVSALRLPPGRELALAKLNAPAVATSQFVYASAPKPTTPFALVDPATGKAVAPTATIVNRANGKAVNAGQYWALVNRIEAGLNAAGHSLREGATSYDLGRKAGSQQSELLQHVTDPPATVAGGRSSPDRSPTRRFAASSKPYP
jgi:hypothetical protein